MRGDNARTFDSTSTPGHLRHAVVGHDDVDVLVADDVERLGAVRREEQVELTAEHDPHRIQHALLVVDEQ